MSHPSHAPRATEVEHFVAHLKIERVTRHSRVPNLASESTGKREVEEVTTITLKKSTLPALVNSLGAHLELIEEES